MSATDEQPQIGSNVVYAPSLTKDAQQDVLDQLWELFTLTKEQAEKEARKDEVSLDRLATLVEVSSHAADNYRYHAGH